MDERTLSFGKHDAETSAFYKDKAWGHLRLIERVGQGSFGEVYRALDTTLQREVALKLLMHSGKGAEHDEQALLQEARAMARVRHPNVASVFGVDTHEGRAGFWSDFVSGKTLAAIVAADGPFSAREAALIGVDVCKAAGAVHFAGLLHRDIKAGNVMRESGGRILLMDFGLTHDQSAAYHPGGTLLYMAPELFEGAAAAVATDIYALGVLLFFLMTSQYPVNGDSYDSLEHEHRSAARQLLLDLRPDLPEPLARAVERAIHPSPERRYQSTAQMIAALTDAVGLGSTTLETSSRPRRGVRRWWLAAASAATLATVAALAIYQKAFVGSLAKPVQSVQSDYATARDLLDHYYRPSALKKAIPLLQTIVEKDPGFAPAFADLGRANMLEFTQLRDAKYLEPARKASLHALSLKPDLASPHVTLGMLYTWTGKGDLASQELDQAVKLDRFHSPAYVAKGNLLLRQGRDAEALSNLEKAVDLTPEDWGAAGQLASYYDETGKLDLAAQQYERAVQLAPDNPRALNNLAYVYRKQGRLREAEAADLRSIGLEPTAGHYRNLGQVYLEEGKPRDAQTVLERAVALKADNYRSWGFLALAYAQSGADQGRVNETYRQAIALTESLRTLTPDSAYLFADLGGYYAALGLEKESEAALRRALAYAANTPEVFYQVSLGYELLHQRDQALNYLEKAVAGGISPRFLEKNLQLAALRQDRRYLDMIGRARHSQ